MCMCFPWSILNLWLVLILSVVAQEGYDKCPQNMLQQCLQDETEDLMEEVVCVYSRDEDGIVTFNKLISLETDNPVFPDSRLPLNISCNVSYVDQETHLYISWDTSHFPDSAQYTICYQLLHRLPGVTINYGLHVDDAVLHILIQKPTDVIILQLNVSLPDMWFIQKQQLKMCEIEKPSPPQINATIQSNTIYLEWNLPTSIETNPRCFEYELRINNEVKLLEAGSWNQNFTEQNVDPSQIYKIQMRAKKIQCCDSLYWSDWTSVLEVGSPAAPLTDLHIGVIIGIALGLPMILLAILLLCKFQRILDKLFPPIPGPSIKIKGLLEKDITSQIMSHKYVEEVTEVEVKEDEQDEEEEENEEGHYIGE